MNHLKTYFLFVLVFIIYSCSEEKETKFSDTYLDKNGDWRQQIIFDGDTVNKVDAANLKQGKWIIFRMADERSVTAMSTMDSSGFYQDNKKIGFWIIYNKFGEGIDSVLYENGIVKPEANKTYTFTVEH